MNSKKVFSKRLYLEGIKQLTLFGSIFAVIVVFVSFFCNLNFGGHEDGFSKINDFEFIVMGLYLVAAPVMVMYIFRFLNTRSGSDFYHSIPCKRECIYFSYIAAVLTWVIGIVVGNTVVIGLFIALVNNANIFNVHLLVEIIGVVACIVLATSVTAIAVSFSGRLFNAFTSTYIIMFFPGTIMFYLSYLFKEICQYVPEDDIPKFMSGKYNLIISNLINADRGFESTVAIIYTFIIAIIYLVIGCIIFKKRKSENAGNVSTNRIIHIAVRTLITVTVTFIPLMLVIYNIFIDGKGVNAAFTDIIIIMLFIAAIIVYFTYELISVKRLKGLIKAIPGLLIVVALDVCIVLTILAMKIQAESFAPSAEEVDYIELDLIDEVDYTGGYDYQYNGIKKYLLSNLKIYDKDVIEEILKILEEEKQYGLYYSGYYNDRRYEEYEYDFYWESRANVKFHVDGVETNRIVYIRNSKIIRSLFESVAKDDNLKGVVYELFKKGYENGDVSVNFYDGINSSTDEEKKEIFEAFLRDLREMSTSKVIDMIFEISDSEYPNIDGIGELYFAIKKDNCFIVDNVKINSIYTKNTYNKILKLRYENSVKEMNQWSENSVVDVRYQKPNSKEIVYVGIVKSNSEKDFYNEFIKLLKTIDKIPNDENGFILLSNSEFGQSVVAFNEEVLELLEEYGKGNFDE